jgi:membrane protein
MFILTSLRIVGRAAMQFSAHGGTQMGAALAYYALFSTAPLLVLAVLLAQPFFGEGAALDQVHSRLNQFLGPENAKEISHWMDLRAPASTGALPAAVSITLLILGTLGAFLHLRYCFCVIWALQPPDGSNVLMAILNYILALVTVLCVGLLLLLSLLLSTILVVLTRFMKHELPGGAILWSGLELAVSFLLLTLFFAVIYRVLSGQQIPWFYVWYGSLIAALLFVAGKVVISLYLAYSNMTSVYGAAGSLVIFLVWVYYSSQIAFFGAELIQARRTKAEWMTK